MKTTDPTEVRIADALSNFSITRTIEGASELKNAVANELSKDADAVKSVAKKAINSIREKMIPKRKLINSISMSCKSMDESAIEAYRMAALDMRSNYIVKQRMNDAGIAGINYDGRTNCVKFILNENASNDPIANIANAVNTLDGLYYANAGVRHLFNNVPTTTSIAEYDSKTDSLNLTDVRDKMNDNTFYKMIEGDCVSLGKPETLFGAEASNCKSYLGGNTSYKRTLERTLNKLTGVDSHEMISSLRYDSRYAVISADVTAVNDFMIKAGLDSKQLAGVMSSASSEFLLKASMAGANIHSSVAESANAFNQHVDVESAAMQM